MMFLEYNGNKEGNIEVSNSEWETKKSCENAGALSQNKMESFDSGVRFLGYLCLPKNQELYTQQQKNRIKF